jgi:hypothetical protein
VESIGGLQRIIFRQERGQQACVVFGLDFRPIPGETVERGTGFPLGLLVQVSITLESADRDRALGPGTLPYGHLDVFR